jgi:hypothetical protein
VIVRNIGSCGASTIGYSGPTLDLRTIDHIRERSGQSRFSP